MKMGLGIELGAPVQRLARKRFNAMFGGEAPSRHQLQGLSKARTDSYRSKIPPVGRQNSVDPTSLGNRSHRAINQAEIEICESGIQLEGTGNVGRKG